MNTNQSGRVYEECLDALEEYFIRDVGKFVVFTKGGDWSEEHVKDVEISYNIEFSKRGLVHTHIYLAFEHDDHVSLDFAKLRTWWPNAINIYMEQKGHDFRVGEIHLDVKTPKNSRKNILDYATKAVTERLDDLEI